ncbi:hypothetical protein AYX19_21625 (plasmid) [Paenarthrobacter ureafaciens]|nr:hypothetical protein AYX19_21625 [Paenarthrobacter ureafaciens]
MMPEDGIEQIRSHDAILLGSCRVGQCTGPRLTMGLLIPIRRAFAQYVNLRPIAVMEGVPSPLAARRTPAPQRAGLIW